MEAADSSSCDHVQSKIVKTVKVRYKNTGRLPAREVAGCQDIEQVCFGVHGNQGSEAETWPP